MTKGGGYLPVGFIDDAPSKLGQTIHGVKVLGAGRPALRRLPDQSAGSARAHTQRLADRRSFVGLLEGFKVPITTLPSLTELVNGKAGVKQMRPVAIGDLLP
jgi:FlaA1/EpsC-like NDP-sugar epimerase